MKGTFALLCALGLLLVLAEAGRNNRNHRRRDKSMRRGRDGAGCKYYRKAQMSECDPVNHTKSVTFYLKKGINCPPVEVYHQPCGIQEDSAGVETIRGCKYERKAQWTDCGPGVLSKKKVMILKPGQPDECPPTRTKTVPCKKRNNKGGKMRKKKGKGKGKGGKGGKGCKYYKEPWSACDASTNTRTRQLALRKGDSSVCLPSKTITKKCKKPCKYNKGAWSPCNTATNQKSRMLTLRKGDPSFCNATMTDMKPCRRRDAYTAAATSQCKYKAQRWGKCDTRTNTMTRVLQLKSGDPALCQQVKQLTRKCRKPCKFSKGQWSECEESTKLKTRIDHLMKGDGDQCERTRVISKKCGKDDDCLYDVGSWGECEGEPKERTRVKTLLEGDPEKCQAEIRISRPCMKPNGEESCFLGSWGEFGPCQNGVMMKHRAVIAGGVQCERKAVKTKPCS